MWAKANPWETKGNYNKSAICFLFLFFLCSREKSVLLICKSNGTRFLDFFQKREVQAKMKGAAAKTSDTEQSQSEGEQGWHCSRKGQNGGISFGTQ